MIVGCFLAWGALLKRGWTRPRVCHRACPDSATQESTQGRLSPCLSPRLFGLCHPRRAHRDTCPRLPKRVQGSPYQQQQQGPDIFLFPFSTAGAALPFHNPAPGKPLNETPRFACRTQQRWLSGHLGRRGLAGPVNTCLPVLVSGWSHKGKKRFEMLKAA